MNASSSKSETKNSNNKSDQKSKNGIKPSKISAASRHDGTYEKLKTEATKDTSAVQAKKVQYTEAKSLPDRMRNLYDRKHSAKYGKVEKIVKQVQNRKRDNELGFQERTNHRHPHQAARQREYLNFVSGLPLDFDPDDKYGSGSS